MRRQQEFDDDRYEGAEKPLPKLGWRDIVALIIAAYQVLFPVMLAMFGALFLAYWIFRMLFT